MNSIGLERKGFSKERLQALAARLSVAAAIEDEYFAGAERDARDAGGSEDVQELMRFIETAERGIVK